MQIVVINGMPRVGKDQFVTFCHMHTVLCKNLSTVDFVKEIAAKCGWDGTKTPKNREFLSNLKDLLTDWDNVPFKKICYQIELFKREIESYGFDANKEGIVFIHCREPKEITKFVDELGAFTVLVRRDDVETNEQSNHADAEVFDYEYDYFVENNGTLLDLEKRAIEFLKILNVKVIA